jgi:drug/metabolite transporter (DMT)-like permease
MGELAALSASAVWAMASMMFSRLGRVLTALALNWLKCLIALVLMFVALFVLEGRLWPEELGAPQTLALAVSGLVGLTIGDTAFFNALNRLGTRRTLLLSALAPPLTAMLAVPVLGEPIGLAMLVGMGLTLGGVTWVIMERHSSDGPVQDGRLSRSVKVGVAFAVVAALCQATGNVLTKWGGGHISALEISIVRLAFGVLGLSVVLAATRRMLVTQTQLDYRRTALVLFVATFLGTFMGIWLMNAGLRYTQVGIASTLSSTSPIFVLPLAYWFDGERLSIRSVAGAMLAVVGVAVLFLWGG